MVKIAFSCMLLCRLPWASLRLRLHYSARRCRIIPPPPSSLTRLPSQHSPLEISPDPLEFSVLGDGEATEKVVSIRNTGNDPLTLERVETSCPCISVSGVPLEVGPHESGALTVTFHRSLDQDPEFRVSVQLTGYLTMGQTGFRVELRLRPEE